MNDRGKAWLMAFSMGILLPGLLFSVCEKIISRENKDPSPQSIVVATEPTRVPSAVQQETEQIAVLTPDGQIMMDMQAYLTGVLLAEMPADFEEEALKAQAVVSRTYALRRSTAGSKHPQNAVCTESTCCQAYRSTDDFLSKGGTADKLQKIIRAVENTQSQVLTYKGELIEATYFSCSGGRTEAALAVWGTDIPYLQAVDSPGEENASHFVEATELTIDEFAALLGISPAAAALGTVTYTDGGGVDTIAIGGKQFSGTEVRQKLGLRSTAFAMYISGDVVYISTKGYGHRVGMSQYGAEAMAAWGSSYQEILYHYYPGTQLTAYTRN